MKVSIFGTGYVGLATGTCLSEIGHDVTCLDVDETRIESLKQGRLPIYEPGLAPMVARNSGDGRLHFTTDAASALEGAEIVFIAVGTPPDEDGSADLQYVLTVAATIGANLRSSTIVVNKSTVPVGTARLVEEAIAGELTRRGVEIDFEVVSNPEFLKEGDAVNDCMRPDRIVIGAATQAAVDKLKRLYAPFVRNHDRFVVMDVRSAELTKYAANAMLATKISFMNEIANIAERVGADVEKVRQGIGSDPRIGWQFIYPGVGYGGSCFPKDIQALARTARQHDYEARLIEAVEDVNQRQKGHLFELILRHYGDRISGRTFALWGLAFKPNTDDMRAASSRRLIDQLWQAGARVRAYDPEAMSEARRIYGERAGLVLCDSMEEALGGADALAVVTEWRQFRSPDLTALRALGDAVVFDGRNVYDPAELEQAGIAYYGIGRGRSLRAPVPIVA
ncbi:UDP-glucose/GDP-mannose dehydrogenase family protein [Luteimonas sp. SJ-92]|uniref:UDP-glucose 6-dehydrogenase n=1 Tax=Luteimonas salinisoli TaxID=2752307 RepID=A0A853J817_9GAMM|nr:UDP-glucose/GDP-mannose dehydrogenase family protein [Luteimonas salinisoli]NZA25306.1 UDP-glucose/GDP-mannose dehydrogenase family protein [Luteimonas salinisoli]